MGGRLKLHLFSCLLFLCLLAIACGDDSNDCIECINGATTEEICQDNFTALSEARGITVSTLEEYLDHLRLIGFSCN